MAELAGLGAQPQCPLWVSTSIKDHAYPDTMYVPELVAVGTVNTNGQRQRPATAHNARTILRNLGYVRPEKQTVGSAPFRCD